MAVISAARAAGVSWSGGCSGRAFMVGRPHVLGRNDADHSGRAARPSTIPELRGIAGFFGLLQSAVEFFASTPNGSGRPFADQISRMRRADP